MKYPRPDILGFWVAKWIVLPVAILWIAGMGIHAGFKSWKCRTLCREQGYVGSQWIAADRFGAGEKCICRGKIAPDGTTNTDETLVIDLD
jgi:hypothetical protein